MTIATIKNSSYLLAIGSVCTWLDLDPASTSALAALIVLDVFTGVLRAGLLRGWNKITSSRFQRGIISKLMLMLIPISIALGFKGMGYEVETIAQSTIALMILSEVYSIIANIVAIRTGEDVEEMDLMSIALRKVQDKLKVIFDNSN